MRAEEVKRLRQSWQQGKASGPAVALDRTETRAEARRRLKKASEQAA